MSSCTIQTSSLLILTLVACSSVFGEAIVPASDKSAVVQGNNAFALDLYGKLCSQKGNLFLSPASIATALAMTYAGARGETAKEMAKTLHFTLAPQRLHPAMGMLVRDLNESGKKHGCQLRVVNALWVQLGYPFLPEFLRLNRDYYGAGTQEVNFIQDAEAARRTINAWVEKQTQDKIKDLFQKGVLNQDTRLVLTNAIYFEGLWETPFKKEQTLEAPFHVSAREKVRVPLMSQTHRFNYLDGDKFQALEMPYAGADLSMVIFLPKAVDGLANFEKTLTANHLNTWLSKLSEREVVVHLPRFKAVAELNLNDTLSTLGMARAFSREADFSGLTAQKALALSTVVHKAWVDVNEKGTKAAAATGTGISVTSVPIQMTFQADHPFFFLIRDRRSHSILFMGRLSDPR